MAKKKMRITLEVEVEEGSLVEKMMLQQNFNYLLADAFGEFAGHRVGYSEHLDAAAMYVRQRYGTDNPQSVYPEGGDRFINKVAEVYQRCKTAVALKNAALSTTKVEDITPPKPKPHHEHDCNRCVFIGTFEDSPPFGEYDYGTVDIYTCGDLTDRYNHNLIARYGDDGNYASMTPLYLRRSIAQGGKTNDTLLRRALYKWKRLDPDSYQVSCDADGDEGES